MKKYPIVKLMIGVYLLTTLTITIFSQERETLISELKSSKGKEKINQTVTIKGSMVVYPDGTAFLVDDIKRTEINTLLPESSYILIDSRSTKEITQEKYHARTVVLTGKVIVSDLQNDKEMAKSFGESYLLRLSLSQPIKIVDEPNIKGIQFPKYMNDEAMRNTIDPNANSKNFAIWKKCKRYAILFSGGANAANSHPRYWNDIQYMYQVLRNKGYTDQDIVVIYKDGVTPSLSFPVDYPATTAGWTNAVAYLQNRMNSNGKGSLFFFATNHGGGYYDSTKAKTVYGTSGNKGGVSDSSGDESILPHTDPFQLDDVVYFYNQTPIYISDDQLAGWINSIPFTSLIAVLEPCFSGGLIWDLRGTNRIVMSAANEFEYSWGFTNYDIFSMHFTDALNGKSILTGATINADYNKDCVVSIVEAFKYAQTQDTSEYPQFDGNGNGISNESNDLNFGDWTLGCNELRCKKIITFPKDVIIKKPQ
jgi:hypothetical protein